MLENTINDDKTIAGGIGTMLAGRYHILRQLGEGGMGSVWLAEDRQLDNRKVAIKMLPSIVVTDKRAYQQLKSEALVSLKLVHPNIVTLRAFEENNEKASKEKEIPASKLKEKGEDYMNTEPEINSSANNIKNNKSSSLQAKFYKEGLWNMAMDKGDKEKAMDHFKKQLAYFRQFYLVKTICMHGSPTSRFDGRDLWKKYDYHDYGIIGEPYFDVDFSNCFYLTDTGRRWDGFVVSVRDKIPKYQDVWSSKGWTYHGTDDIIEAVEKNEFPKQLMMTTHPQRWTDGIILWSVELAMQSAKNVVKKRMIRKKD